MKTSFAIALGVLIITCGCGESTRDDLFTCASPDGKTSAIFYREFGGGAAGWQTESVAVRVNAKSKEVQILELSRGYDASLEWVGNNKLNVGYPNDAKVLKKKADAVSTGDIQITYSALPAVEGQFSSAKSGCAPNQPLNAIAPKDGAPH